MKPEQPELDPFLRDLVRHAQDDLPSERQLAALAARVGPAAGVTLAAGSAKAFSFSLGAKIVAAVVTVGAISTTTWVVTREPQVPANTAQSQTSSRAAHSVATRPVSTAVVAAPSAQVEPSTVVAAHAAPQGMDDRAQPSIVRAPLAQTPRASRDSASTSGAQAAVTQPDVVATPPSQPAQAQQNVAPQPAPLSEIELLSAAQSALATDPARALTLTQEHAQRFANSNLMPERELCAVRALLKLSRRQEALARAQQLREALPANSLVLRRLDVVISNAQ